MRKGWENCDCLAQRREGSGGVPINLHKHLKTVTYNVCSAPKQALPMFKIMSWPHKSKKKKPKIYKIEVNISVILKYFQVCLLIHKLKSGLGWAFWFFFYFIQIKNYKYPTFRRKRLKGRKDSNQTKKFMSHEFSVWNRKRFLSPNRKISVSGLCLN